MATQNTLNNIQATVAPGGGYVFDDATAKQITSALNALQTLVTAAQASADAAKKGAGATIPTPGTNVQSVGAANSPGVDATLFAPDDHIHQGVLSLHFSADAFGAITFVGSSVSQNGAQFDFTPFGTPALYNLPATYTTGDTFVVLTPSGAGQTFTLPLAASVPPGFTIRVHTGAPAGGNSFNVGPASGDTYNTNAGLTFQINPLTSTAYIGALFVSDGVSRWYTSGYN